MAKAQKKSPEQPTRSPVEKMQDEMLRDVDESLRQEKLQKLWDQYGSMLVTAAVGIILATAVMSGWKSWKASQNESLTTDLIAALDSGTPTEKLQAYISENSGIHQVIASFELAGQYREKDELDKAVALYKDISENKKVDDLYRDLGTLLYASASDDSVAKGKLKKLYSDEDNPWRAQAGLEWALHLASEQKFSEAIEVLETISEQDTTPIGIRQKTAPLITLYQLKGAQS